MSRTCEICGEPIGAEREECVPDTRLCILHARMMEEFGGEFVLTAEQERLHKEGSLKKNYGGVSTKKHRNTAGILRLKQKLDEAVTDG